MVMLIMKMLYTDYITDIIMSRLVRMLVVYECLSANHPYNMGNNCDAMFRSISYPTLNLCFPEKEH